jgi:transglutaminase-like putative cysteine protease
VALAVAAVPHLPYLPPWVTAAALGCALWRFVIERQRRSLPSVWTRSVLALAGFLGILFTFETISGVGPGTALLAIMAALKLLETRKRRDQVVLLFIAIFLIMAALLREQHLWSLPYMLFSLVVTLGAWLRMSAAPGQPRAASYGTAIRFLGYAAPLAIAMWVLFPRLSTPFWAVPIDTSAGVTGLSDTMSPGDITSLSESQAVAFRVRFETEAPAPRDRYWRAIVLHRFNGRTWTGWDPTPDYAFRERTEVRGDPIEYQVTLEPTRTQWLVTLDVVDSWNLPRSAVGRNHNLWRFTPVDQRLVYRARSFVDFNIDNDLPEQARRWYLGLPENSNPRTVQFAEELRRRTGSDEAFVRAVLDRFHEEDYYYTLQPPGLGSNPVDRFLFDTQRGFCEHFASAFAVLARAAGIPSRIVLGYQGGETNPMGDYMIVRQADAHAWTEIWLPGKGWQRIDPTAAVAPERIEAGRSGAMFGAAAEAWGLATPSRLVHRLGLTWDALNTRWNEFVLGYGPENQDRFMRRLGLADPSWRNLLLTLIGTVVALTLIVHVILMLRFRPPREDQARRLYNRFLSKTGITSVAGESPLAFAERVALRKDGDTVRAITALYLDTRYGDGGDRALAELSEAVRRYRPQPV